MINKEELLKLKSKSEFMNFLETDMTGKIFELLDDEGINILKNHLYKEETIRYIFAFSRYKNELLNNNDFLDILLKSDISNYYAVMRNLSFTSYDNILSKADEVNLSNNTIAELLSYFSEEYQFKYLDNLNISKEIVMVMLLSTNSVKIMNKIMKNFNLDFSNSSIRIKSFFSYAKSFRSEYLLSKYIKGPSAKDIEDIEIPQRLITKELANNIWTNYNIFDARGILNDAVYSVDISVLNDYFKNKEDYIISNSTSNSLIEPYNTLLIEKTEVYIKRYQDLKNFYEFDKNDERMREKLVQDQKKIESEFSKIRLELTERSNKELSNYIVDYHFEENYYNVMLDIKELLLFSQNGSINLSKEKIELYNKIYFIDRMSVEEKKELHNQLKTMNVMEMFYDDMLFARTIVNQAIKDYSLSSKNIVNYKDEKLSKEYGVDVYVFDGEPFFGIVKTGIHIQDDLPTGHSYSIVGSGGLSVYGDVKTSNTFLYDSDTLMPDQIVHVFPFDSFTLYKPFNFIGKSTSFVNFLALPDELVNAGRGYNEILILEKGKEETDIDQKIPQLKRIALYCIDEITEKDIDKAKVSGIGIILINSKKYVPQENASLYEYRTKIDSFSYNYSDLLIKSEEGTAECGRKNFFGLMSESEENKNIKL